MKNKNLQANSYYEGLIQNLYSGTNGGCFLCFMQFFYQSVIIKAQNFECFEKMSQIELENCKILSVLLQKIGGDHKFYSSSRRFLSGHSVNYSKDVKRMFLIDIELLEANILDVKSLISKIENPAIKDELKKILENKRQNLKLLKENFFRNNLISQN